MDNDNAVETDNAGISTHSINIDSSNSPMLLLPKEMLECFLYYLSYSDLGKCMSTCKDLYHTIKSSSGIWNRKKKDIERREGPRIVKEFKRILKGAASAENLMAAVVDIEKRLANVEHNLTTDGGLCVERCESGSLEGFKTLVDFDADFDSQILLLHLVDVEDDDVNPQHHIRIVSLEDLKTLSSFPATTAFPVPTAALCTWVNNHLVFGICQREIWVFDWKKMEKIQRLDRGNRSGNYPGRCVTINGNRLAAISDENMTIKVWKLNELHDQSVHHSSFAAPVMEIWWNVAMDLETLTGLAKAVGGWIVRRFSLLNGAEVSTIHVDAGAADHLWLYGPFLLKRLLLDALDGHFETSVADSSDPSLSFNPTDCRVSSFNPHYWGSVPFSPSTGKMIVSNRTHHNEIYRIEESEAGFKTLSSDALPMSGKFPAGFIMTDGFSIIGIGIAGGCSCGRRLDCWTVQIRHCFF